MKLVKTKIVTTLFLIATCSALNVHAQDLKIQLEQLDHLEIKATQVVTVDIPQNMLKIGAKFLKSSDPDEATVKELVSGLKGVYVKSFEFQHENEFTDEDVRLIT